VKELPTGRRWSNKLQLQYVWAVISIQFQRVTDGRTVAQSKFLKLLRALTYADARKQEKGHMNQLT